MGVKNILKLTAILFGSGAAIAAGYVGSFKLTTDLIDLIERKAKEKNEKKYGKVKDGFEFIDIEYEVVAEY